MFTIDKQTNKDLNLSGRYRPDTIFSIYNKCATSNGSLFLETLFNTPLSTVDEINSRRDIFTSLTNFTSEFPCNNETLKGVEEYLNSTDYSLVPISFLMMAKTKMMSSITSSPHYTHIVEGINLTTKFLKLAHTYFNELAHAVKGTAFESKVLEQVSLLSSPELSKLQEVNGLMAVTLSNRLLRYKYGRKLTSLLKVLAEADCYATVARVGKTENFTYANAIHNDTAYVVVEDVKHPKVKGAVGNDIKMDVNSNIIFLTGANMAGKSTIMKSFGISIYMAHIGFPIAVKSMTFAPLEGIYTSINVPDDISQGYSHFYAEVMRVKSVVDEIATGKPMLIIFDELFKGTNVKDAFDGTYAITKELANSEKCIYIISTHIMEVGEELKKDCKNVQFKLMPTSMGEGGKPKYTYKITDGIADDRYGMHIINNEKIIEIIKGVV